MISIGDRLNKIYKVTKKLGSGAFGEVFLAHDGTTDRDVAIKMLSHVADGNFENLIDEMKTLASLNHPHIVTFYHHFTDRVTAQERLYLVMEYCSQGSLHDWMEATGAISELQTFTWGLELCETLEFVHNKGIVHHDIKPQNILFDQDGTIKIADFGVANQDVGTFSYVPPEMHLGERITKTDPRVDVYALGVTLLEMLLGRNPFDDLKRAEIVQTKIAHDFVSQGLSTWVQEVLLKATHPTPELRFQNAAEFAEAIRGRHVRYVFDKDRIHADTLAKKSENALNRKKWKTAERLASDALLLSSDCVAALLAAGRCQLSIRRLDRASEYFSKAVAISPRTPVQKELGWINLEQGRIPTAISLLTDHVQRNASDYEAYNLLLKCFFLSDRFEAGAALAQNLIAEKSPSNCFVNNLTLCMLLLDDYSFDKMITDQVNNPFIDYNLSVLSENPSSWSADSLPSLKSKLFFEEYRLGLTDRSNSEHTIVIHTPEGASHKYTAPIVSIGRLPSNDVVIEGRTVSRRHALIVNFANEIWVYDLASTCGVTVDGETVNGRAFLDGVHDINFGDVSMRIASSDELLI